LGDLFGEKFMASHAKLRTLADYLPLFAADPLQFEPGAQQKYSNAGYVVLGLIVERVSGQSYYDYVRDHITKPLGMKDTASYAVVVLSTFDPPSAEQIGQSVRPLLGLPGQRRVMRAAPEPPGEVMIGGRTEVPMMFARHVPVIEAKVNGKGPFRFALDTGFAG